MTKWEILSSLADCKNLPAVAFLKPTKNEEPSTAVPQRGFTTSAPPRLRASA